MIEADWLPCTAAPVLINSQECKDFTALDAACRVLHCWSVKCTGQEYVTLLYSIYIGPTIYEVLYSIRADSTIIIIIQFNTVGIRGLVGAYNLSTIT